MTDLVIDTTTDRLQTMLEAQEKLQVDSYGGIAPGALEGEQRLEFIRWNVLALEDELHELLGETGWKPWATSKHVNQSAAQGELVDAWHFFMNLMLVLRMSPQDLVDRYEAKRQKNADRQANGYDGTTDKCPQCKRALDDVDVTCTRDSDSLMQGVTLVALAHHGICEVNGAWSFVEKVTE